MRLISVYEAAGKGIDRLRLKCWSDPFDHIKITIDNKGLCPWIKLYSPFNKECNDRDPVEIFFAEIDCDAQMFSPYGGPLPDSEEYLSASLRFKGVLSSEKQEKK